MNSMEFLGIQGMVQERGREFFKGKGECPPIPFLTITPEAARRMNRSGKYLSSDVIIWHGSYSGRTVKRIKEMHKTGKSSLKFEWTAEQLAYRKSKGL
jgi:hypothetical protein